MVGNSARGEITCEIGKWLRIVNAVVGEFQRSDTSLDSLKYRNLLSGKENVLKKDRGPWNEFVSELNILDN